ncbi:MAG TPA: hypothetical protein VLK84_24595 [Longimicrobium sp.]|nr:hypothetical protein [Longimicrobium sp.]
MHAFSGFVLRFAWLATIGLAASAVSPGRLRAQDTIRPAPAKSATSQPDSTSRARPTAEPRTASAKSLSQKIFESSWVLFPTRMAVVIVLVAIAVLFLMSGAWGAVRFAHLLRHLEWKEPPRRLKRGELGAAGANLAFEFEERLNVKREEDEERDRQIAWLRTAVLRLSAEHNEVVAALELVDRNRERGSHGKRDDVG